MIGDGRGGESIWGPTFDDEIVAKLSHDRVGYAAHTHYTNT